MYFMKLFFLSALALAQSNYPKSARLEAQPQAMEASLPGSTRTVVRHHVRSSRKIYKTEGFGHSTQTAGSGVSYKGNVGIPYGSNIIEVTEMDAHQYKYIARFRGNQQTWTVVIWNKIGPDGALDGWYGHSCKTFTLTGGQTKVFAFDENSQGGWAAAPGGSIPLDSYGGYASTWGEFDFGSRINPGWSGFDVSAIAAQSAGLEVQGMKICDALTETCSTITPNGTSVSNAYTLVTKAVGGIGGNLAPGPVRLNVTLGFQGDGAA